MFAHFPLDHWLMILFCLTSPQYFNQPTNQRYAKKDTDIRALQGAKLSQTA